MKKTFVFLLSTLFWVSTADICLARGGDHGGRPPENGQSRGMRPANSRGGDRSMTRQSAHDADSEGSGVSGSFNDNERQSGDFGGHRGMNPPPPPPLDENGSPMPPPDGDGGQSGGFGGRHGMNPPPPPPLDEDGNPLPPPDEDGDFKE